MTQSSDSSSALMRATALATLNQLAMVIAGHFVAFVRDNLFAIVGMAISLLFGGYFALRNARTWGVAIGGGALVGGVSALIGIAVSAALGDVPMMILLVGTLGSTVAGMLGGAVFYAVVHRPASTAGTGR
jgi:hypothetical protein